MTDRAFAHVSWKTEPRQPDGRWSESRRLLIQNEQEETPAGGQFPRLGWCVEGSPKPDVAGFAVVLPRAERPWVSPAAAAVSS